MDRRESSNEWTTEAKSPALLTDLSRPTWPLKPGSTATRLAQRAGVLGQRALGLDDPVLARALPLVRLAPGEGVIAVVGRVPQRAASLADHRGLSMLRVWRNEG
jgi:hypothetical protein